MGEPGGRGRWYNYERKAEERARRGDIVSWIFSAQSAEAIASNSELCVGPSGASSSRTRSRNNDSSGKRVLSKGFPRCAARRGYCNQMICTGGPLSTAVNEKNNAPAASPRCPCQNGTIALDPSPRTMVGRGFIEATGSTLGAPDVKTCRGIDLRALYALDVQRSLAFTLNGACGDSVRKTRRARPRNR